MGLNVLVTGGAGFIGSHLVDGLVAQGHTVRVLDSLEPQVHGELAEQGRWPAYANPAAEYILGDVRQRDVLPRALAGVEVVFHQAAAVGVGQSMYEIEHYVDVNVRGTATLLDVLANEKHSIRKLIVASSMSIYGEGEYRCPSHGLIYPEGRRDDHLAAGEWEMTCPTCDQPVRPLHTHEDKPLHPTSIYALTKRMQEDMCLCFGRAYHVSTVALRYFNVYGSRQALSNPYTGVAAIFSARLLNGKPPVIFEDGLQSRDFVNVSDIVRANLLAMNSGADMCDFFNVGSGRPVSILHVAETLAAVLGVEIEPEAVHSFRKGDIRHCFASIDKARLALRYAPQVTFEDEMRNLADWVRVQEADDRVDAANAELRRHGLVQ